MSSCVKEFDEPCATPAGGVWVAHDKDGFSTELIELKQGKFIKYVLTGKKYYSDKTLWAVADKDVKVGSTEEYGIVGGKITIGGKRTEDISVSDGIMKIGKQEYYPVEEMSKMYFSTISHDVELTDGKLTCDYTARELTFGYDISERPLGNKVTITVPDWVTVSELTDKAVKLLVAENNTKKSRSAKLQLTYPTAESVEIPIVQTYAASGVTLAQSSLSAPYTPGQYELGYTIQNPRENAKLTVVNTASWVKVVSWDNGKVIFELQENNTGASRKASLSIWYHDYSTTYSITQAFESSAVALSENIWKCEYQGGSHEFTYEIQNPRVGAEVSISCSETGWITFAENNGKVSVSVDENNSGKSRSANIVFKYGEYATSTYVVEQSYSSPQVVLNLAATSCDYTGGSYAVTYSVENPRKGCSVSVKCDDNWITGVTPSDGKVSFTVTENNSGAAREGKIQFSYGNEVLSVHKVQQSFAASNVVMNVSSTVTNYTGGNYSFTYNIENPREGKTVGVSCSETWVKDLKISDGTVTFMIPENNSGATRTTDIVLTYNSVSYKHTVKQTCELSSIVLASKSASANYKGGDYDFTYSVENPRNGLSVEVKCNADWIVGLKHANNKISFSIPENNTGSARTAKVVLTYGDATAEFVVSQSYEASVVKLNPASVSCTYAGGSFEVACSVENPRNGQNLTVSCDQSWITGLKYADGKITFSVPENNSGSARNAKIIASYGTVSSELVVNQSYVASVVKTEPSATTCNYLSASHEVAYSVENPRKDYSVSVSCSQDWIRNLVNGNGKISFDVPENNSGADRTAKIVFSYGEFKTEHVVTQTCDQSKITMSKSSSSVNYAAATYQFTYAVENPREGLSVDVACSDSWITGLTHSGNTVSFNVLENNTGSSRSGKITLTYGSVKAEHVVTQTCEAAAISLTSTSTTVTYSGGQKQFTYTVKNPREGLSVTASSSVSWITGVSVSNGKVTYTVAVNNSGASRTGYVNLNYGSATAQYKVTQSYSAPSLSLSKTSTSATYTGGSFNFTYTISNPRTEYKVALSCDQTWITSLKDTNGTVSFSVSQNSTGASRTATITLTYGTVTKTHTVTQAPEDPSITLSSSSVSHNYSEATYSVTCTIKNPQSSLSLSATSSQTWITGITVSGSTVTYKVAENNTGASRSANITLKYGSASATYKVTQTYSAYSLSIGSTSTSAAFGSGSYQFSYSVANPRKSISATASANVSWITDCVVSDGKVSFKVAANTGESSRSGTITVTYGTATKTHTVTQAYLVPTNLSSNGTANCYIISEPGAYKFKSVKGNSSTNVASISSVSVLWETYGTNVGPTAGDLVGSAKYSNGYITFYTGSEFKEGNAVIAARDASGNVLWSWHIWFTDKPAEHVYKNNAGTLMDRNLGATSATPGEVGALGLLYQWGRKDPFIGSSSVTSSVKAKTTTEWTAVSCDNTTGTLEYAIANPTTFIKGDTSYHKTESGSSIVTEDWLKNSNDYLWDSSKTIYDPCPVGWKVPDGYFWENAGVDKTTFDSTNKGYSFPLSSGTAWYPLAGYMSSYESAVLKLTSSYGYYLTYQPQVSDHNAIYMITSSSQVTTRAANARSFASSVRCMKE